MAYVPILIQNAPPVLIDWAISLFTNPEWTDEYRLMHTIHYVASIDPDYQPFRPSRDPRLMSAFMQERKISVIPTASKAWMARPTQAENDAVFFAETPELCVARAHLFTHLEDKCMSLDTSILEMVEMVEMAENQRHAGATA